MKAISYSLFGYNKPTPRNCFSFDSYMRGLMINVRINRVLYPNWDNVVNLDKETYTSPYKPVFDWLQNKGFAVLNLCESNQPLCVAMLWRLKPVFFATDGWTYSHVLCRDVDSVGTYREAQAVAQWIQEDKTIHCITDSISHNIPMMGGMVGFRPEYLTMRLGLNSWEQLFELTSGIDFNVKGSDQDFMNRVIYPRCADSATEHFVLGMVHNLAEGNGRHYSIPDIDIDVPRELEAPLNAMAGHIGAAGAYTTPLDKFLIDIDPFSDDYAEIESQFKDVFYWRR